MGKIYKNILELVGNTPLVELNKLSSDLPGKVLAKIETFNPCSSVKDRIALAMINDAQEKGIINQDTTIIEPTSGNTGIGLAMVCASKEYKLELTMPDTMSIERRKLLAAFGAKIILTDGKLGMKGAISKAQEILHDNENYFMPQQFQNPANPNIHKTTTAEEIWSDTDGNIDIFVSGVGTGGTITGVGLILKNRNPDLTLIAVEPEDSAVLSGENPGPHKLQGIGAGFIPEVLKLEIIDKIIKVSTKNAFFAANLAARKEGILTGISSGAALWAALAEAKKEENRGKVIVVLLPDTGERYLSTNLFDHLE
ncbi:MAG: cysteine synthase A [Pseudomonadota bacterium]